MKKVAVIGASGYTGIELMRLLAMHPRVELVAVSSEQFAGKEACEVFPFLAGKIRLARHQPSVPRTTRLGARLYEM